MIELKNIANRDKALVRGGVSRSTDPKGESKVFGKSQIVQKSGKALAFVAVTVIGLSFLAVAAVINGTSGNDTLYGTSASDNINGFAGQDVIWGRGGNDVIDAGPGNDRVYGEGGNDQLYGKDGNDLLYGGDGNDTIGGDRGRDTIFGGGNNDTIMLSAGDVPAGQVENIDCGTGSDTVIFADFPSVPPFGNINLVNVVDPVTGGTYHFTSCESRVRQAGVS